MQKTTSRLVSEWNDCYGRPIVKVALSNNRGFVELARSDYDRLLAADLGPPWKANANSARAGGRIYVRRRDLWNHNTVVARFIAGAADRHRVTYVDGNPFNLRRENLRVERGGRAKRHAALTVRKAIDLKAWADAQQAQELAEGSANP